MASTYLRRKGDSKRATKYTIMVTGPSGTGKTTFINALLDTKIIPYKYEPISAVLEQPKVQSQVGNTDYLYDSRSFNPLTNYDEATIAITTSNVKIEDEDGSKLNITIVDTPGFGENLDNEICFNEIVSYLQQQFDHVLSEETRIKRNPKFEDTRVHACLYFIEPNGHGLKELDIEGIKKISKYVNVLPVISKCDSFTTVELQTFKNNILHDISKYSIPVFEFNYDEDEDDIEVIEENRALSKIQPFAIMTSKEKHEINGKLKFARKYHWGLIDIEESSDFLKLKKVLLDSHLQDFKDLTTNFLYENYRSEKLSSVTDGEKKQDFVNNLSLSNLASLTLEEQKKASTGNDAYSISSPSLRSPDSLKPDIQSSSIKEIFKSIKEGNEAIISSIRNSPSIQSSPDPSRSKLRVISETIPYVLKHERILSRQQKLQELEEKSARELALRAAALEKKAAELKRKEKSLKNDSIMRLKKEETLSDLASIVKKEDDE